MAWRRVPFWGSFLTSTGSSRLVRNQWMSEITTSKAPVLKQLLLFLCVLELSFLFSFEKTPPVMISKFIFFTKMTAHFEFWAKYQQKIQIFLWGLELSFLFSFEKTWPVHNYQNLNYYFHLHVCLSIRPFVSHTLAFHPINSYRGPNSVSHWRSRT